MSSKDNIEIFDDQRFTNEKLDYTQIIMRQVLKISSLGSTELKGGYFKQRDDGIKEYLPSTRDGFMNAVKRLEDLLTPYLDQEYTKYIKENYDDYIKEHQELIDQNAEQEKILDHNLDFNRTKFRLLTKLMQRMDLLLSNAKSREVLK